MRLRRRRPAAAATPPATALPSHSSNPARLPTPLDRSIPDSAAPRLTLIVEKEHQAHVDSLKVTTAKKAQSAEGARELAAAVDAADGLKVLSQECRDLEEVTSAAVSTAVL